MKICSRRPGNEAMRAGGGGEFSWQARVYYEDTDAAGVVFYANYLRYMERARTEWLRSLGFEQARLAREHNILFAVRSQTIDYKKPGRLDDLLTVTARLLRHKGAILMFRQTITREQELLTRAEVSVACLRADTLKSAPIPRALALKFEL